MSRRRKIFAPLAVIALLASTMLVPAAAGALPPPEGGGSGGGSAGGMGSGPETIRLQATSHSGTVALYQGMSATRDALSGQSFYLNATMSGFSPARYPNLLITEDWACGWYMTGSRGSFTTTAFRTYTVSDLESRCSGEGLFRGIVTAVAVDPKSGLSTGRLEIHVYGYQMPDDRMPNFSRW
jgi:hypothetical protein